MQDKKRTKMTFEIFTRGGQRVYKSIVSIYKDGYMGFNKPTTENYNLRDYQYAILYFNSKTSEIGIKFSNEAEVYSYKINKQRSSCSIQAKGFVKYYNIKYPQKKISDIRFEKGLLIVKVTLNEITNENPRN